MSDPTDTLYFSAVLALQQRDEAEKRALRWEALARQLGEALEHAAEAWTPISGCADCESVSAALAAFREAVGEG